MTTRHARRVAAVVTVATAAALGFAALVLGCTAPLTPAQRGHYLRELEQSLGAGQFQTAVEAAHAGLAQKPHPDDAARTEEHLRLGGAAALAALGRDAEAVELLRPLYTLPGMAALEAETVAVLTELELRAAGLSPALCAIEVLHQHRGLEYETLRTAAILYRALGMPNAALSAESAAAELAHAYGAAETPPGAPGSSAFGAPGGTPAREAPGGTGSTTGDTGSTGDTSSTGGTSDQTVDCAVYGGVPPQLGIEAYREYIEYREQAGRLMGSDLDRYAALEPFLHRFPGYYMGLVDALKELIPGYRLSTVRPLLERVILLSPRGPYARLARQELGTLLGIGDSHGERLLLGLELEDIASRLSVSRVPETVAPIVALLATPENPYRSAGRLLLLQALDMPGMRGYLEAQRDRAEGELRHALELILAAS